LQLDEYIKDFHKFRGKLLTDLYLIVQQYAAAQVVNDIEQRTVQTQTNYKGGKYSTYSKKPTLSSGTTEKSSAVFRALAGSRTKRRQLDWVTVRSSGKNIHLFEVPGGYAQIRRIEGFSNTRKSFEFTGQMWRGFGVKKQKKTTTKFSIIMGGKTVESQNKIDENSQREGIAIIGMSKQEQRLMEQILDKKMNKLLQKYDVK
jgi:hypothetical protein